MDNLRDAINSNCNVNLHMYDEGPTQIAKLDF